jgi:hypothetical protein
MNAQILSSPRWSTSSFADAADTSPMELSQLGAHIARCNGCRERWFTLRCVADALHDFVSRRIVTTLVVATAVIGISSLLL